MGGPPIEPEMKALISRTHREMRDKDPNVTARKVRAAVSRQLERKDYKRLRLPKLRTFQELIRKAKKVKNPLFKEWTIASLTEPNCDLPADAIPYLVRVWRYAVNTGESFTIMQAKWVARLYRIWTDTTILWHKSKTYSDIERDSLVVEGSPNTIFEDTEHFFSAFENFALHQTGYFKSIVEYLRFPVLIEKDGMFVEELIHYNDPLEVARFDLVPEGSDDYHRALFGGILALPALDSLGFNESAKFAYLRFYSYMIRGPKWKDKSAEEAITLIKKLREWILQVDKHLKDEPQFVQRHEGPWPLEIMNEVGHELKLLNEDEMEELYYEGTHNKEK